MSREHPAGKGDSPRPLNKEKFDENMENIFGVKPPIKTWNPEEDEEEEKTKDTKSSKRSED